MKVRQEKTYKAHRITGTETSSLGDK